MPSSQPSSSDDRLLKYYDHCIAANPQNRRNYTRKFAFLLSLNHRSDAVAALSAVQREFPDWWQPPVALAFLAGGGAVEAEANLRRWVKVYPAFIHWWYLSRFYRDHGDNHRAIAALQEAVKYPLEEVDEDETWVPTAYAFDAAAFAYRQKKFELVLDIADVWSNRAASTIISTMIFSIPAAAELYAWRFCEGKAGRGHGSGSSGKTWRFGRATSPSCRRPSTPTTLISYTIPDKMCGGDWAYLPAE